MKNNNITYSGNDLFNIDFNLYSFEDINFNQSIKNIKKGFEGYYLIQLKKALNTMGLKFVKLNYFSPKYYNYSGDSLDLTIKIINKELLKKAILKNKSEINKKLSQNKGYDGYTPLTIKDTAEELKQIDNKDYEMDILVFNVLLNKIIDFSKFDKTDFLIFDN